MTDCRSSRSTCGKKHGGRLANGEKTATSQKAMARTSARLGGLRHESSATYVPVADPRPTSAGPILGARARLFMKFSIGGVAYDNGEMNWPKYALLLQAIELALKAYCLQDGRQVPKGLDNHDLKGWYDFACACGLPFKPDVAGRLDILGPVHLDSSARYPKDRQIHELANIADETARAIVDTVSPFIRTR